MCVKREIFVFLLRGTSEITEGDIWYLVPLEQIIGGDATQILRGNFIGQDILMSGGGTFSSL